MKEFDYKAAWKEVAEPAFLLLPQNVRDLYERVCIEMGGVGQNRSLGLDWPEGDLKRTFAEIPAEILFEAQATIDYYGHWSSTGHSNKGGGGTWKFRILAKQSLIERGWCTSGDRASWTPARYSEEALDKYMIETDPKIIERDWRRAEAVAEAGKFVQEPYSVVKIDGVTRPHPFVIGSQHLTEGVYLDPNVAPCAGCRRPYDEHITEDVLFVGTPEKLSGGKVPEALGAMLMEAKAAGIFEKYKIDGVAFLEGQARRKEA